ncbi:MAG TPA: BTAD domain-containing putative transcriptional regulator [Gemmatimonadaceae bacterium]|nr:BTAD domain-containing putative transcriptional regulator [Gemmatimonadaceae bacterium]
MIELRMLGVTQLRMGEADSSPSLVAHPRLLALLSFLSAARPFGSHTRDELVAMFWPELDQEHARAALRKALHRLRKTIGEDTIIVAGGETIGIADSAVWCDVAAFHDALDAGRVIDALKIYRGDLLPGFFVGGAPQFERWLDAERIELRSAAAGAAWKASDEAERSGDRVSCARWARYSARLTPDDEQSTRRLISTLDRIGDRTGAIRAYEDFGRYLADELDLPPSKETDDLVAAIRMRPLAGPTNPIGAESSSSERHSHSRREVHSAPVAPFLPEPSTQRASSDARATQSRLPGYRLIAISIAVAVSLALAVTALTRRPTAAADTPSLDMNRIAVMVPENNTGRRDLDLVGLEIQDWVTRGIQETGLGLVFPAQPDVGRPVMTPGSTLRGEDEREWASRLRVGTLLKGRYYLRGDSLLIQMSIVSPLDGHVIATTNPVSGPVNDPIAAVDGVRRKAIAVLATVRDPALAQWARSASQPPSFESYREFSEGLEARNRDDYEGAVRKFEQASALDSSYVYPLLMATEIYWNQLDRTSKADSLLKEVRRKAPHMAPFDDAYADVLEAELNGKFDKMFEAAQRLRRYVTPGSEWELYSATAAVALRRPAEAMRAAKSFDLHRPAALDSRNVFVPIANAYHLAGENEALLELLQRNAGKWQGATFVVVGKMRAAAALSRPQEVIALWRTLLHRNVPGADVLAMWAARQGASELRAHGLRDAGRALAIEALDSIPNLPATSRVGPPLFNKLQVLREAGRTKEALVIARARAQHLTRNPFPTAEYAAMLAETGDTAAAKRIESRYRTWPSQGDPAALLLARAFIAAGLNDKARAVALLRVACEHGCYFANYLHTIILFDGLLDYPPFQDLLRPRR